MLNQIVLVGRITKIEERETSAEKTLSVVTIAIPRSYKNINGEYDTDFVDITLWNGIATNTLEYCKKGDLIGIKGRVEKLDCDNELKIIAEKVTFLSSNSKDEKSRV